MSWLLNHVPIEVWIGLAVVALLATFKLWLPVWSILPGWAKAGSAALVGGVLAYLHGRNKGAEGALKLERERNERASKELVEEARVARERQRVRDADGVRVDADPFRRD